MQQKYKLLSILMALICSIPAYGQNVMDVVSFRKQDKDLMARVTRPVRDHDEGKLCALIRIVSPLSDLRIRPDALGMVDKTEQDGETWVYVPYGARNISISHAGYIPVMYQYPVPIEEGTVYELVLQAGDTSSPSAAPSTTQMLALTVRPDEAKVYIDGTEFPVDNGVVVASLNKGEHIYRVEASMYEDASGTVDLGDRPVRENVALFPLFGTLNVSTLPDHGFEVILGDEAIGTTPIRDYRLSPGNYKLHISRKNYYPVDTVIRLRAGAVVDLNCRLTSHADSLFYNRQLGGRKVSFGIRAGYLYPMVSTAAKGEFTGSAINYGIGDSRENIGYSSQTGFTVGLIADIRLYKNLYLQTGLDYRYFHYINKVENTQDDVVIYSTYNMAMVGTRNNVYTEQYSYHELQIPVMASYKFVLGKRSSLHVNLGPYMSFGLKAAMKLSGSTVADGQGYRIIGGTIRYDHPVGPESQSSHTSSDINLYSSTQRLHVVTENGIDAGVPQNPIYHLKSSPLKRFNFGLCAGVVYELSRFQLGVQYSLELTNRANGAFWDSDRIALFNTAAANKMSDYRHNIHTLAFTLGFMLR